MTGKPPRKVTAAVCALVVSDGFAKSRRNPWVAPRPVVPSVGQAPETGSVELMYHCSPGVVDDANGLRGWSPMLP